MQPHSYQRLFLVLTCVLLAVVSGQEEATDPPPQEVPATAADLVKKADAAIKEKEYDAALEHYSDALELEPDNSSTLYKRASLYLLRGKKAEALTDLNLALEINPNFRQAYIRRGKLFLGQGKIEDAKNDFNEVLELKPTDAVAKKQLEEIDQVYSRFEQAKQLKAAGRDPLNVLNEIVKFAPDFAPARALRAEVCLGHGLWHEALEDTTVALKVDKRNLELVLIRGKALYGLDQREGAVQTLSSALKIDPDHKEINAEYKKIRGVLKTLKRAKKAFEESQWQEAIDQYTAALEADPNNPNLRPEVGLEMCKCYLKQNKGNDAITHCDVALADNPANVEALLLKADAFMVERDFDKAFAAYSSVLEHDRGNQRARQGQQNAQKRQKEANRKDYYKILGLERSATNKEIRKAYRILALEYHPDKQTEETLEHAEKMYLDIGEAYEVLSDDEMRGKYDRGEDIDPQPSQQPNPFQQFFRQGGGGRGGGGQNFHFRWG